MPVQAFASESFLRGQRDGQLLAEDSPGYSESELHVEAKLQLCLLSSTGVFLRAPNEYIQGVVVGYQKASMTDVHITCLYSYEDTLLWTELLPYFDALEHQYRPHVTWHKHEVTNHHSMNDPQIAEKIKHYLATADIVLLGLSVDLALSLYEQGSYIYHLLVKRIHDQLDQPTIIFVLFRTLHWEDDFLPLQCTVPANTQISSCEDRTLAYREVIQVVEQSIILSQKRRETTTPLQKVLRD